MNEALPTHYQRWHLYGAGLHNVGKNGQPETVELVHPAPDQILVRHDAVGICYSDIKIINLGENHPRLAGRDLQTNPVIMGHEVALTIVEVGENYKESFASGQRFIVQADVFLQRRRLGLRVRTSRRHGAVWANRPGSFKRRRRLLPASH